MRAAKDFDGSTVSKRPLITHENHNKQTEQVKWVGCTIRTLLTGRWVQTFKRLCMFIEKNCKIYNSLDI